MPTFIPNATKLTPSRSRDSGALLFGKRQLEAARQPQGSQTQPSLKSLTTGPFWVEEGAQT